MIYFAAAGGIIVGLLLLGVAFEPERTRTERFVFLVFGGFLEAISLLLAALILLGAIQ